MQFQYITYGLVFAAVAAISWVFWSLASSAGMAAGEKRDFENNVGSDGRQKTPLERFVSPGRLFNLQLLFSCFPALFMVVLLLASGLQRPLLLTFFAVSLAIMGWKFTRFYFVILVRRRQAAFESKILDLTNGLANALKAGMALPQALERITARMSGVIREELSIVLREYRLGLDLHMALERLYERMPCEDMRLLTASVRLTTQTGGSLADVLAEMTEMIRGRKDFKDKLKALTAQGRFEGIVLGCMPVLAFVLFFCLPGQREMMMSLFTTPIGWAAIGVAALLEVMGFVVISKITAIEV